jgi:hypothetical protein
MLIDMRTKGLRRNDEAMKAKLVLKKPRATNLLTAAFYFIHLSLSFAIIDLQQ